MLAAPHGRARLPGHSPCGRDRRTWRSRSAWSRSVPCRAGFTFVELLVVITLLGLMSTLVVANLDGLTERSSLNASARELGNTLLSLRDQAAMQQRELTMELDVDKQRWRVVDVPSATDVIDEKDREEQTYFGPYAEPRSGVILDNVAFSRNDVARHGVLRITFDADGQIVPAGFVAYFRTDGANEDEGVSVEVTGLTGLVDYSPGRKRSEEIRSPDEF